MDQFLSKYLQRGLKPGHARGQRAALVREVDELTWVGQVAVAHNDFVTVLRKNVFTQMFLTCHNFKHSGYVLVEPVHPVNEDHFSALDQVLISPDQRPIGS